MGLFLLNGKFTSQITPIFKSGDPSLVNNYQPISLLSNTSKVLERLVFDKIIGHIRNTISLSQFGFMKRSSTLQQMLVFLNHIVNNPAQTDVIYLDIHKAFDTVSHSILLHKLWLAGITGSLWAFHKEASWAPFYFLFT